MSGIERRLRRLEGGEPEPCPECGWRPHAPDEARFSVVDHGESSPWPGYPQPLLCSACRRVLRFTFTFGAKNPWPPEEDLGEEE